MIIYDEEEYAIKSDIYEILKEAIKMVKLELLNQEWYFLHVQIERLIKENPDNYIAKNILNKLVDNSPKLEFANEFKFQKEYECIWIGLSK